MASTHTITREVVVDGRAVSYRKTYSGNSAGGGTFTIADGSSDLQKDIAIEVADVVSFVIGSDQALTIKTNSTSAPDDTITLAADYPLFYTATDISDLLTADVTVIYVTNASGSSATLHIEVLEGT